MYPICRIFHTQNLRKQYISVKRAFCIRIDIFFISANLTIIEGYYIAFLIGNITVFYQKFARNVRCLFHFPGICTVRICHRLTALSLFLILCDSFLLFYFLCLRNCFCL